MIRFLLPKQQLFKKSFLKLLPARQLSVKQLLLLGFLFTALLPMLIVTVLTFYQARATLRQEITRDMQTRATAALAEVDSMMFERLQNVASWSRLEVMHEVVIGDVDKQLSNFLSELKVSYRGVYRSLDVVNHQNIIIASSDPAQIGKSFIPKQDWMHIKFANDVIYLSKIQQNGLAMTRDIVDAEQKKIGSLSVVFDWAYIQNILKNTQNKGSAAALLDAQGNELGQTADWGKILAAHDIAVYSTPKNLTHLPIFDWQVGITQYRAVAMAPVQRMGYIFIFLLLITGLLATLLAAPLARLITQPLARLTDYANRFMRSTQVTLPPADGPSEVRDMSNAFGKMMDDLSVSKENLTRAAKLAVAGEMAAAMSHEVRTPLGILRSSAQVLSREKNLSPEGQEVIDFITTETDRLNKLVSTLVDSARPRQPEFAIHDIIGLLEHAVAMLRMQANKKDIELTFASISTLPKEILIECDGEQITQVVLNLLLNAIQVLPVGGKVVVSLFESTASVVISVADNGVGVAEAQKEQIFDPFFTQRPGGIGLGLAVSRQIVTAHFGALTVEASSLQDLTGQSSGADFRVKLPKHQSPIYA